MQLTDDEWKKRLTPEQYRVLREKGTEAPGSGAFLQNDKTGEYVCAACGAVLFASGTQFESTMPGLVGWPAFSEVMSNTAVRFVPDDSLGMHRVEIVCANCGSHLGHYFDDPSSPTAKHYCVNSVALDFKESA